MIASSIPKFLRGEKVSFTSGVQLWDYLYSTDAGYVFYLIGQKASGNKVYCIGSGKVKPLYEYIEIMRDIINPDLEIGIGEIPYSENTIMNLCADISEIKKDTGFQPQIDFYDGIKLLVQIFK